jgi:hypothetical protein
LTFSQEIIADDDDDNKLKTSVPQNHATAILYTEEFFLRTQHI